MVVPRRSPPAGSSSASAGSYTWQIRARQLSRLLGGTTALRSDATAASPACGSGCCCPVRPKRFGFRTYFSGSLRVLGPNLQVAGPQAPGSQGSNGTDMFLPQTVRAVGGVREHCILMKIELVTVDEADKSVLMNLIQFYQYDFSEIRDLALTRHGTFTYRYLDPYFTEMDREADFITVDGQLAGFTLTRGDVDGDGSWNVAEFFVARHYRRQGVARVSARRLFARRPGVWTLSVDHNNQPAAALWRSVISTVAVGPIAETDRYPPDAAVASTRFRFRVADAAE
jgi:predicted acetyltransferase